MTRIEVVLQVEKFPADRRTDGAIGTAAEDEAEDGNLARERIEPQRTPTLIDERVRRSRIAGDEDALDQRIRRARHETPRRHRPAAQHEPLALHDQGIDFRPGRGKRTRARPRVRGEADGIDATVQHIDDGIQAHEHPAMLRPRQHEPVHREETVGAGSAARREHESEDCG